MRETKVVEPSSHLPTLNSARFGVRLGAWVGRSGFTESAHDRMADIVTKSPSSPSVCLLIPVYLVSMEGLIQGLSIACLGKVGLNPRPSDIKPNPPHTRNDIHSARIRCPGSKTQAADLCAIYEVLESQAQTGKLQLKTQKE